MGHVYGDSTPFPFDINFIELLRHAIDCGVALLQAQHEILTAVDRTNSVDALRKKERGRLEAMSDALRLTMTAFNSSKSERLRRAAQCILEEGRAIIESELGELEGVTSGQMSSTRAAVENARDSAYRAVESFILKNDVPPSTVSLRLLAAEVGYTAQAHVKAPFGVEAVFALAIPAAHDWGRHRRVAELSAGTEVHVPMATGFFSKRVEVQSVKLDRLVITEVAIAPERSLITLRRQPRAGDGFLLEVATDEGEPRPMLRRLGADGTPTSDPLLEMDGEDAVHLIRLWTRVVETTRDVAYRRQVMTSASFDGKPLTEIERPRDLCERMVMVLAPVVQEIARRSGAPGELVLRRDLGQGRREEIYITKAELHEKVMMLPESLRGVFDAFELSEGPRSPRAPSPSEPIFLDVDDTSGDPTTER
jgi:hypothetical protein